MDFLSICKDRGFFHQCTDEDGLRALTAKPGVPAYIGFDCTAPSLHVGSLLQIMLLRWWQKCGHKPIVLMGGGTTKIGDPSGKDEARKMLTDADIGRNMDGIKQVFAKFLEFEPENCHAAPVAASHETPHQVRGNNNLAVMVNNDDWLKKLGYIELLREFGSFFSVNQMIKMDSVKLRLERESHLSFLEFNYMILQAYDFVELRKEKGCRLQMGGSDQWGNITQGTNLNRSRAAVELSDAIKSGQIKHDDETAMKDFIKERDVFGLTSPLITTSSGAKMGKTASGAVWLNHDEHNPDYSRSPYDYWQFWRNTEDGDVERFLKLFTELPLDDIAALAKGNPNDAKKVLATEATAMLHGREAAEAAAETARQIFEQGGMGGAMPEVNVPKAELEAGIPAFKLLQLAGLAESGGEARRLIKGKGAKMNDVPFDAEDQKVTLADFGAEGYIKLSKGKKDHVKVLAA